MKFEYTRPADTKLEAYGRSFDIPPKTAPLVDGVNAVHKEISKANSASEQAVAIKKGISLFIGECAADELFPDNQLDSVNLDELSAFWLTLNEMSNRETELVTAKYAAKPKSEIRVPVNPKK